MARHPAETFSVLTHRTGIQDANLAGNVHGGWLMKLCDDAAVIAATRLAGGRVVTAAVDAMKFRSPVKVGDVITLRATVNAAWRTSMEVGVRVEAEHVPTGGVAHTCTACSGSTRRSAPLPLLFPRTPRLDVLRRSSLCSNQDRGASCCGLPVPLLVQADTSCMGRTRADRRAAVG
jgi:acyl-CoA hydrolase